MKQIFSLRSVLAGFAVLLCVGFITAQAVTFNVAGTNPRCKSEFPNGVPYSGSASVWGVEGGARIKYVTFQIQYQTGAGWAGWSNAFTITPGFSTGQVNYSNSTPNAPVLNITATNLIRMRALIVYQSLANGNTYTAVVYSSQTQFNHFGPPALLFQVNGKTTSATTPLPVFLCEGTPMINFVPPTAGIGTGIQWRLLMFNSDANGTVGTPFSDYAGCPWQLGSPPITFDPDEYGAGCHRPGNWIAIPNPYLLFRIEFRNDCGVTVQDALVHVATQPSGAQVNFAFGGGGQADNYFDYGPGSGPSDEEFNGVVSNSDGILSWGGTYADPTWVGGASTHMAGYSFDNFYGGLNSWTVKVEDVTAGEGAGQAIELGMFGGTGIPPAGGIFFSDQKLGPDPNNREEGYFITNFNSLIGKIFKVTLTGSGVCNQNPSKSGYFRLIPGGKFWLTDPNQGVYTTLNNNDQSLSIYPNPTRGAITIDFNASADVEGMIRILDMNGRVVSEVNTVNIVKGKNVMNEDVSHLIAGHYVLQVINGNSVQHKQFMKSE